MTSDKKNISLLADLFIKKGLSDIIISPGSRNAPIVIAFAGKPGVNALSIVDERSAGFFAIGMALQSEKTVAVACTSGSAALNYAPAIAEAYYQKVPLLVLTADRPPELIERGYGQIIRQKEVYKNYIKSSFELPVDIENAESFKRVAIMINEAINQTQYPEPGPVHINLPFREPLYGQTDDSISSEVIDVIKTTTDLKSLLTDVEVELRKHNKIMILAGQQKYDRKLNDILSGIVAKNIVLLSETTSNLYNEDFVDCIDNVVSTIDNGEAEEYTPDFLITFGGQVVSKMVKKFLRKHPPVTHWHISPSGEQKDTYFKLKRTAVARPEEFFEGLLRILPEISDSFFKTWQSRKNRLTQKRSEYLKNTPFSDMFVFDFLLKNLPEQTNIHLGNSTPVRYSQLFGSSLKFKYFSNRGVSGIDGQVSTAAGAAFENNSLQVLITGDLGFLYDSNGLMNHYLKPNLKIIVINNAGGGIFRFIEGPEQSGFLEEFFEVTHSWKAEKIAEAFGLNYFAASNEPELKKTFTSFILDDKNPAVFEIFTPSKVNAEILKGYFNFLKE